MEFECIFCGDKVKTNDASYEVVIQGNAMEKEQIVSSVFTADICGLCASHFEVRYINWIKSRLMHDEKAKVSGTDKTSSEEGKRK